MLCAVVRSARQGPALMIAGHGRSTDARQGYENFIGTQFGVKGALRRDEEDTVSSLDPYVQAEWQSGPWQLSGGLRHSL